MVAWKTDTNTSFSDTILLLSDRPEVASLWETLFVQRGFQVIKVNSPEDGAYCLMGITPALIVVDVNLAHEANLSLCRDLRMAYRGPLLLMVSHASVQEIYDLYQMGVDECLVKPSGAAFLPVKAVAWMRRYRWMESEARPLGTAV